MRVDAVSTNRATSCDDLMNRTGTDLEISSSRLYHLEMASSASSEAPRRPLDTPKCVCGPNLAQGWHRIRSQQNAPIAAPHAAPSPPAQSSLRPAAAPSYHPRPLPRAAQRRALRFSPQIHAHFSRSQIGRFLRRSGASGRLLGTRGRARGGSIAPNSIFAGVPRATS